MLGMRHNLLYVAQIIEEQGYKKVSTIEDVNGSIEYLYVLNYKNCNLYHEIRFGYSVTQEGYYISTVMQSTKGQHLLHFGYERLSYKKFKEKMFQGSFKKAN